MIPETQEQHLAPMEFDCGIRFVYRYIVSHGTTYGIFQNPVTSRG